MEQNKQKNPRRRLNSLILLVAFTAIMLIVSTYAWFSSQKTVTIGGLKGTVNVAEGLQISLDAKNWSQSVNFAEFADQDDLKKLYGLGTTGITSYKEGTVDASYPEHNIIPSELLPVSTTGKTNDGIGQTDMNMYRGINTETKKLDTVIKVLQNTTSNSAYTGAAVTESEHDYPGYYAIDFFLQNSSKATTGEDILQLNSNSKLELQNQTNNSTGLQNAVRVAFARYTSSESTITGSQTYLDQERSVNVLANQQQILKATTLDAAGTGAATIADVAIWEPNASDHTAVMVNHYNVGNAGMLKFSTADASLYTITDNQIAETKTIPTYALNSAAVGQTYANLYDWSAASITGMEHQITLKTEKTAADNFKINGGIKNLVSVTSPSDLIYRRGDETGADTGVTTDDVVNFTIPKAQVSRIRMYVWLEGQDIDTLNQASHGGGIFLDVGMLKDGTVGAS